MQESNVAVNPQETNDLAWLAGIWEGEGHMSIVFSRRKSNLSNNYRISLGIVNSDEELILAISEILDKCKISSHIETRTPTKPDKHKVTYYVSVYKLNPAKKLCELLIPYLKGRKKSVAKLMLRFIDSRLSYQKPNEKYSDEEISLYDQLKKLNHKGPSETTREALLDE